MRLEGRKRSKRVMSAEGLQTEKYSPGTVASLQTDQRNGATPLLSRKKKSWSWKE